jgi:VWFA-related protein
MRQSILLQAFVLLFLTIGLLAQSSPAATNQAQASPQNTATSTAEREVPATILKATTRLVLVDTIVTDRSGHPLTGLKADSFELTEDGVPQKIHFFSVHTPEKAEAPENKPSLPQDAFTNVPSAPPNGDPPTVLLLDALNTPVADQKYARQQMLKYLKTLNPGARVAVYLLGTSLRMVQDFTTDPQVLQAALSKVGAKSSPVVKDAAGDTDFLAAAGIFKNGKVVQAALEDFENDTEAMKTDYRVMTTLEALRSIARNVAGYPGRKNLVWVSSAFPLAIGLDPGAQTAPRHTQDGVTPAMVRTQIMARDYSREMRDTADQLTNAQVAVYPVGAEGLTGSMFDDVFANGHNLDGSMMQGDEFARAAANRDDARQSAHQSMNNLAEATGGRAFYNLNDINNAIARSIADGSTYYTLGYYPADNNWNGHFRKIQVKLLDANGARVRARSGYYALDTAGQQTPEQKKNLERQFEQALDFHAPESTALPFVVKLFPPKAPGTPLTLVYGLDPTTLSFSSSADGLEHGSFGVLVQAFNSKGKPSGGKSSVVTADLKPDAYEHMMQNGLHFTQQLKLGPGKYALKIGVLDQHSGLIGTVSATAEVPASQ